MHLVTQMSHTSSGLHASPSGWMNERAERLAGGGARRLRGRGVCQLLNVIKKVSVFRSQGLRRVHISSDLNCGCPLSDRVTDQAESPPPKSHNLGNSGPALTRQTCHSAKVQWASEERLQLKSVTESGLHLQICTG